MQSRQEKALRTRAKNQQLKAKELKLSVKGIYTPEAKKVREEASKLQKLSEKNLEKAKGYSRARRAEQKGITAGEQLLKDKIRTQTAREAKARKRVQPQVQDRLTDRVVFEDISGTVAIDTARRRLRTRHGNLISTSDVIADIDNWFDTMEARYGINRLNQIIVKATEYDANLFTDMALFNSNSAGNVASDILNVLEEAAAEVIPGYQKKKFDEERGKFDTGTGKEEMYD